jgi:hypothetical protein
MADPYADLREGDRQEMERQREEDLRVLFGYEPQSKKYEKCFLGLISGAVHESYNILTSSKPLILLAL